MSVLYVIKKFNQGDRIKVLRELGSAEVSALIRVHSGTFKGIIKYPDINKSANILGELADLNAWLACDCNGGDLNKSAIFYQQRISSENDTRKLVRNNDRNPHQKSCPFYTEQNEATVTDLGINTCSIVAGTFSILKDTDTGSLVELEEYLKSGFGNATYTRTPKLARILYTIMSEAGLNFINHVNSFSIDSQIKSLKDALATHFFDKDKKICVGDFTQINLTKKHSLIVKLKNCAQWKTSKERPQGFLIGLAKEIDEQMLITLNDEQVAIKSIISVPGEKTKGPYLVIILVGAMRGSNYFNELRAFAQPVFSETMLIPVDSDLERKTLEILMRIQKDIPFAIEKPVFNIDVADIALSKNIPVRPDFILNFQSHSLIIETMGYSNVEYLERKKRTHTTMSKLGRVFEHKPGTQSDIELREFIVKYAITQTKMQASFQ